MNTEKRLRLQIVGIWKDFGISLVCLSICPSDANPQKWPRNVFISVSGMVGDDACFCKILILFCSRHIYRIF